MFAGLFPILLSLSFSGMTDLACSFYSSWCVETRCENKLAQWFTGSRWMLEGRVTSSRRLTVSFGRKNGSIFEVEENNVPSLISVGIEGAWTDAKPPFLPDLVTR
jgi:hypothetical protein